MSVKLLLLGSGLVADCYGCIGERNDGRTACRGVTCSETIVERSNYLVIPSVLDIRGPVCNTVEAGVLAILPEIYCSALPSGP